MNLLALGTFFAAMIRKLHENEHKGGWDSMSPKKLLRRVKQETGELETAIRKGAPSHVVLSECADVANFAMMTADSYGAVREETERPIRGSLIAAAEEFIVDIEAVGIETVKEEWPDLVATYENMKKALKRAR